MLRGSKFARLFLLVAGSWFGVASALTADDVPESLPAEPDSGEQASEVEFLRDVQPIFARSCYSCHGPDLSEGSLRLDRRRDALEGGNNGPAILAGKSAASRLVQYLTGENDDEMLMPPEGEGAPLSSEEIALVRRWIDAGAHWPEVADGDIQRKSSDHWSFQPRRHVDPPPVEHGDWVRNGIDAFVLAKLESRDIAPSPEADRATLIRRLSIDLLGLPPTPAEVEAFLHDDRPDAYGRLVDRLLASPHYGECWSRHWLDLARYADSDGYEKDLPRPHAWRYRNWVIDALNRDLPFDKFTIEQLAGDLLPDPTTEQLVATGFHRNTLTNREGGIDPEEDRVKNTIDRTNTTGTVWLGLTVGCAQCHSHKYDPLSQREYYGLYGFFNSIEEVNVPAPLADQLSAYKKSKAAFDAEHAELVARLERDAKQSLPKRMAEWEKDPSRTLGTEWIVATPTSAKSSGGTTLTIEPDGSILAGGKEPAKDTYTVEIATELADITGLRIEVLPDARFPAGGPGRAGNGNFVLSQLSVTAAPADGSAKAKSFALREPAADFSQSNWDVAGAADDDESSGWGIAPKSGQPHQAVFTFASPVSYKAGTQLTVTLAQQHGGQHTIGRFRVSLTTDEEPIGLGLDERVVAAIEKPASERTDDEGGAVLAYYRSIDPVAAKLRRAIESHEKRKPVDPRKTTLAQALQDLATPRETHVLIRGDFLQPGAEVDAHTPEVLPPLEARGDRADRLDLAHWLVDPAHPLTSRVTVNRIWQRHFGRGLVATSDDFGTQGDPPSHPELLDWLADEFIADGWSQKRLHKLIVTSATYRQSSAARSELAESDPYNALLARQNRLRASAEIVRDLALAASGLLEPKIGGPSVRPPQPPGIAELGYANSVKWVTSEGADRYRRGLYTFFQRTVPYPMLMTFDSPDSNVTCTRRERSNTPLQALTLLNDPVFVEHAQALGRRIVEETSSAELASAPLDERLRYAFRLCLARGPDKEELAALRTLYEQQLALCASDEAAAENVIGEAPRPDGASAPELAAWILVGRTLMNLDEFITRE